jgi:hypothetical protein
MKVATAWIRLDFKNLMGTNVLAYFGPKFETKKKGLNTGVQVMGISWLSECIHIEVHSDHARLTSCNFALEVTTALYGQLSSLPNNPCKAQSTKFKVQT